MKRSSTITRAAARRIWEGLDDGQRKILRAVAGDNPGALVQSIKVRAATADEMPMTQHRLAFSRLIENGLVCAGRATLDGPLGYSISNRGIQVLAQADSIIVHDEVADDRPSIAGHPLPWSIVPYVPPPAKRPEPDEGEEADERGSEAFIIDADGYRVHRFYGDSSEGKLWAAVVEHLAKPRETMADLALAEKAAKVAKLRLENERQEGADLKSLVEKLLPKGYSIVWKEPRR